MNIKCSGSKGLSLNRFCNFPSFLFFLLKTFLIIQAIQIEMLVFFRLCVFQLGEKARLFCAQIDSLCRQDWALRTEVEACVCESAYVRGDFNDRKVSYARVLGAQMTFCTCNRHVACINLCDVLGSNPDLVLTQFWRYLLLLLFSYVL